MPVQADAPPDSLDATLQRAAARFGTPLFVYFPQAIEARAAELQRAFGGRFALSYAVKSNPNPALLGWLAQHVEFVDVSSIGELRAATAAGWDASRASFTGPAKREAELREAIAGGLGELIVESVREAELADRCAAELGRVQDVMIRIAPARVPKGFGDQMAGRPVAFGIDEETAAAELPRILALHHLRCVGLHIYSGTQCLRPAALCENYGIFIGIFRRLCADHDLRPRKLVFGSGLGVPYHDGDAPLDLPEVARAMQEPLDALLRERRFAGTRLVLELGRYLVAEAGYFVTRVVSTKDSRGTRIGICDGGMNHHLPASGNFGMVVPRNYAMHKVGGGEPVAKVDLVGPLCTSIDRLGRGVLLPRIDEGDLIAIHHSGAYGLTASPMHFISHAPAREVMAEPGGLRDVSRFEGVA